LFLSLLLIETFLVNEYKYQSIDGQLGESCRWWDYQCWASNCRNPYVFSGTKTKKKQMFWICLAADATCQFTLIFTGTKTGPIKIELPFKLDGIDDYGYLHVEAEVIVRKKKSIERGFSSKDMICSIGS